MIKVYFALGVVCLCLLFQSFMGFSPKSQLIPIFDPQGMNMPRNFRISTLKTAHAPFDKKVLFDLKASGSGQFSELTIREMLKQIPIPREKIVVIDLRQESHGFINGTPVSWTDGVHNYANVNKSMEEIIDDENQRLHTVAGTGTIIINPKKESASMIVETIKSELDVVKENGCSYVRLPVTDHNRPSNDVIDQFIKMVESFPQDAWVHFHCRAGKGRTTTFLVLLDILKNGRTAGFQEILQRQALIGGIDLSNYYKPNAERVRAGKERYDFLEKFYLYCSEVPDHAISWSDWIDRQSALCSNSHEALSF